MAAPANRPCEPFAQLSDLCCDQLVDGDECRPGVDQAVLEMWIEVATDLLWAATGRRFGICETVFRPCIDRCDRCGRSNAGRSWHPTWAYPSAPYRGGDGWINCWTSDCDDCCAVRCEIDLPRGPVAEIVEVLLDGEALPADAYRVDDWRSLVALRRPTGDATFEVSGDTATLGTLTATGWDFVNPSDWIGVSWSAGDTVHIEGAPGDSVVVLLGPNDAVTWPAGWDAQLDGSGGTIVGNTYTADPNPPFAQGRVRLTLTAGNTDGDIVGTQNNPLTLGFSLALGSSTEEFCWPTCQDMNLPDTEEGTWSIRYRYGRPVPAALRAAVAAYACELAKSCYELECQLPQRVQTITRQGVTVAMLDPQDFIEDGRTGLYLVDQVIKRYNPAGIQARARVYRADAGRRHRRVGT